MNNKLKVLLGALAIAVPTASVVAITSPTLIAGAAAPAYPVVCKMSATVTFSPPLTKSGTVTTNKAAVETTTISGGTLSSCESAAPAGAPTSGTVATTVIKSPATKGSKVNKVQQYLVGYCPGFASTATFKSLKNLAISVNWSGGEGGSSAFTVKSPAAAVNNVGEVGFAFGGKAVVGSYSEKPLNQITAYLSPTSADTALATGCSSNQTVTTVSVDPTYSVAIL
jgi:hypothetical protein